MSEPNEITHPNIFKPLLEIEILPIEDEEDDFDTTAAVVDIAADLKKQIVSTNHFEFVINEAAIADHRSGLLQIIAQNTVDNRDYLLAFSSMALNAIRLLASQRRIGAIELELNGNKLIGKDLDKKTVQELIILMKETQPQLLAEASHQKSKLKVKGYASKHSKHK